MKHTLYTKEFLARKLFSRPTLGLDLHEGAVAFAALKKSGTRHVLKSHGTIELSLDAYGAGVIKEKEKVVAALKLARKKSGMRYVRASLPEEQVYVLDMSIPKTEKKKVMEKVKSGLSEILPVFFNDILVNYEILAEDKETFHLNVAVAKKAFVDEYLALLAKAGFLVVSLEFRSAAIASAIIARTDTESKFIVSIEQAKLSVFAVTDGFIMAGIVSALDSVRDFQLIREKIDRAYIDWHKSAPSGSIKTIILTGAGAGESGLADYLSVSLKMRVECANVWTNVNSFDDYIPEIPLVASLGYHAAIGLALEDFEK